MPTDIHSIIVKQSDVAQTVGELVEEPHVQRIIIVRSGKDKWTVTEESKDE